MAPRNSESGRVASFTVLRGVSRLRGPSRRGWGRAPGPRRRSPRGARGVSRLVSRPRAFFTAPRRSVNIRAAGPHPPAAAGHPAARGALHGAAVPRAGSVGAESRELLLQARHPALGAGEPVGSLAQSLEDLEAV